MNLPVQYTKVFSKHLLPRLCFHGEWLEHLGFEINSLVKIQCTPRSLTLTTCRIDEPVEQMLSGTCPFDDFETARIEQQRLEAYGWLHNKCCYNENLEDFLEEIEESFVLSSTVFDLVYLLLQADLLAG